MTEKKIRALTYDSACFDPYMNIAVERYLTSNVKEDEVILYLWQNDNTVVIGKNQNVYREVDIELLKKDSGRVCRRFSGGGAVYHDRGNLNFSFIAPASGYSVEKQTATVLSALRALGINAVAGGRNDIYEGGSRRKLSGNAYYTVCGACCHHGTLMLDVDLKKLSAYLAPSPKFLSGGVESVRSAVVNLRELSENATVDRMKACMKKAFSEQYGQAQRLSLPKEAATEIKALADYIASDSWIYNRRIKFNCRSERKFGYGNVEFCIMVSGNTITGAKVYTDSLSTDDYVWVESALLGRKFEKEELDEAIAASVKDPDKASDLMAMANEDFFSR